ncbi:unnamed protein product, partial [marine sediment metagenome]
MEKILENPNLSFTERKTKIFYNIINDIYTFVYMYNKDHLSTDTSRSLTNLSLKMANMNYFNISLYIVFIVGFIEK